MANPGAGVTPVDEARPAGALDLRELTKSYGGRPVVDRLSLAVPHGSMFALVGPNGAGKTTLLSMATGLLRPDAGAAFVLGMDVWSDPCAAKAVMGLAPDGLQIFDHLSGRELLRYVGELRGLPGDVVRARTNELLAVLDLAGAANTVVGDYSAGMTKKIILATALIHAPRLLLLDEPFEAVDPVSGEVIRRILRKHVASGGTVVLSSHVMELVEGLCDRVAIMMSGRVLATDTVAALTREQSLRDLFLDLVGARAMAPDGLSWQE